MKNFLPAVLILLTSTLFAQELVQVSYSASYGQQAYYRLSDDATANIANSSWDIAFTAFGAADAGIHINETAIVFGTEMALYLAPTDNFDDVINSGDLTERLFNDEMSWDFGAFNSPMDGGDPNDFGWGTYDPGTETVTGTKVFAIRFKNNTYRKIQIVSLEQGVYTVKHADLDGADEVTLTVDKADFTDEKFAFLTLSTGATLDNISTGWDLLFTRYSTPLDDGAGGLVNIMTSGVLTAPGVQVAQASGIDPNIVEYVDYEDSLSSVIDVIGYDWKFFDNTAWILSTDLAFFVKTPSGQVWKIVFLSFGGSSTGNVVFSKEEVVANAVAEESAFDSFSIFPNPSHDETSVVFSLKTQAGIQLALNNYLGQTVWAGSLDAREGLNAVKIPVANLPAGSYFLSLRLDGEVVTEKILRF